MPYIERDQDDNIVGLYARPQPGRAEEFLADDHPDVVAFQTPPPSAYWQKRKDLYRERIAAYKEIPEASHLDVLGFVIDARIKAENGDTVEMADLLTIIQGVKAEVPKPG